MRDRIEARLEELRQQLSAGTSELQELQTREIYLREVTLRVSGAIQVLEELLVDRAPEATSDMELPATER